ncbi:molybdenum cofactor guanylyltransferase [Oscillatoriales cyanobacterium USR001]|nr:molybdenum cofactor guanylyltransferase [Oscillatoriales cyanobacterium USR001]
MTNIKIAVLILAGGQSSRMGKDKALLVLDNQCFIQRICEVATALTSEVYVLTPWRDRYQEFLPFPVQFLLEPNHGNGPLIALFEGLNQISADWILLLACDLPLLKINVLQAWINQLERIPDSVLAVVPCQNSIWEPLCGFYRQQSLTSLQDFIDKGGKSFQNWLSEISAMPLLIGESETQMLWNCNTPEEFEELKSNEKR